MAVSICIEGLALRFNNWSVLAAAVLLSGMLHAPVIAQEEYVLLLEYETESQSDEGSGSSKSSGRQALAERVIARRDAGTEIEYSIPGDAERIKGNAIWMYPARVLVSAAGEKTLLNGEEINQRVDEWLEKANWPREICGRWIFTWTAYHIRCDLPAIIDEVEGYGMRPGDVKEGEAIRVYSQVEPAVLIKTGETKNRTILAAEVGIDPAVIRQDEAEMMVAVAEMTGKELTLDQALAELIDFKAEGVIRLVLEVDANGLVWRRIESMDMQVSGLKSGEEVRRSSNTVTRYSKANFDALYPRRSGK